MAKIKPIHATPELSGEDAEKIIQQVNEPASQLAINKNHTLHGVLAKIRKQ